MTRTELTQRIEELSLDVLALGAEHPEYMDVVAELDALNDMLADGFYDA